MNDSDRRRCDALIRLVGNGGTHNAAVALELARRGLLGSARDGLTLGPPIHDDQLILQHAGARCGKTNAAAAMVIELAKSPFAQPVIRYLATEYAHSIADVMSKYRYAGLSVIESPEIARVAPGSIYFMDPKNFQLNPDNTDFSWREAKLADRKEESSFARDLWMGAQWPTKSDMESLKTAFSERINEEDSMPTLINTPAGENPAIAVADDCDRKVQIQRVNNGFVVQVGCQTIAFETSEHLCAAIKLFYEDPAKARKKYLHNPDAQ